MASDSFVWRWCTDESTQSLVKLMDDNLTVIFHPIDSTGCTVIRGDKPLHKHMEHWFEVEMTPPIYGQARMVGIGDRYTRLHSSPQDFYPLIGRDCSSWGLNYTGKTLHDGVKRDYITDTHNIMSLLKMGLYFDSYFGNIAFMMNDKHYGIAFKNISLTVDLYPMISATSRDSQIKLTYNHSSIISLKALCRGTIRLYVSEDKDINSLPIPSHLKAYLMFKSYELPKHIQM